MTKKQWEKVRETLQPERDYLLIYTRLQWKMLFKEGKIEKPYRMTIRKYIGEHPKVEGKLLFSHNFYINYRLLVTVKELKKKDGRHIC